MLSDVVLSDVVLSVVVLSDVAPFLKCLRFRGSDEDLINSGFLHQSAKSVITTFTFIPGTGGVYYKHIAIVNNPFRVVSE